MLRVTLSHVLHDLRPLGLTEFKEGGAGHGVVHDTLMPQESSKNGSRWFGHQRRQSVGYRLVQPLIKKLQTLVLILIAVLT